jgi:ketosteroid isomerase-like protein
MSQGNVDAFKQAIEAYNRRDVDAFLDDLDPEVELHGALQALLESEATVYRGHEGVRQWVRDIDEALAAIRLDLPEIRDLGDRIVAIGWLRARGKASGAETESPFGCVVEWRNGKATRVLSFLDPEEALEAAGLSE